MRIRLQVKFSQRLLVIVVSLVIEDFHLYVPAADERLQHIAVGDIQRMPEDIQRGGFLTAPDFVYPVQILTVRGFQHPLIELLKGQESQVGVFLVVIQIFIDAQHQIAAVYAAV